MSPITRPGKAPTCSPEPSAWPIAGFVEAAPDRISGGARRTASRDISEEDFLGAVNETLESASIADERTLRHVSRVVADAVNAYRDPNLSLFQLPGPARGVAVLLHEAYLRGGHTFALVRRVFHRWDVESLLADAWATVPAGEVARYGVPVAIWSDNPGDYRRISLTALPPPHNLWKQGHSPDIYASYICVAQPPNGGGSSRGAGIHLRRPVPLKLWPHEGMGSIVTSQP
jgi:hypothetical protein